MIKSQFLVILFLVFSFCAIAQIPKKRLPQNINVPTYMHIFPSLSGDGNQMIFLTNYTNDDGFGLRYTYKTGAEVWADPVPLPSINRPGLDHIGSFCLSYDGNFMVFSSRRSPGIGNYDIWISEKVGDSWSTPKNPGKPLNTQGNEGNPSLSPDGKSIYFMRCEKMDNTTNSKCSLYVSHKISANRWSEPEVLPDHINNFHESTPRIQTDNKTLVFASGRNGGKGQLDLYTTTLEHNIWSEPKALSFINTGQNDEFVSIPARGDIIYFSGKYKEKYNIYKAIIPKKSRSQKVLMLTGTVDYDDGLKPSDDVLVQAFDLSTGEVFTTTKLRKNDNSFTIFLPEGANYDVSAFPQKGGHTYFAQNYDLTEMSISRKEKLQVSLLAIKPGTTISLPNIQFEEYSDSLTDDSNIAIKRIIGFLKKNPTVRIEINAFTDLVTSDSIPSDDLTEIISDTVFFQIPKEINLAENDSSNHDVSENIVENDSLSITLNYQSDSSDNVYIKDTISIENNYKFSQIDSVMQMGFLLFEETEFECTYFKINYTYHNDRTQKQAESLMNKLIASGVPEDLLKAIGNGDDWDEDRSCEERNYWTEMKIIY